VPLPDLAVLAEGDLPTGEHWILRAGGTISHYYTFLETIHPDGHRDEGGMGGPPLYPGSLVSTCTGGSDRGLRRVVVRADPRVAHVRVELADGDPLILSPVATQQEPALSFFATLLPRTAQLVSLTPVDANGQVLEAQDLSHHEAAWQRFLRQHGDPEA
jgi:hypothetical protein